MTSVGGGSSLPAMTDEQRADGLAKAAAARRRKAEMRRAVAAGELDPRDVVRDPTFGRVTVRYLLESVRGVGRARSQRLCELVGCAPGRRLRALGRVQVERLVEALSERCESR